MKVLVVIDMQNDFIDGALGTPEAKAIVPNVKKKIEEAMLNGDIIVFTRDTHDSDYLNSREGNKLLVPHCIYKQSGWHIPDELLPPFTYEHVYVVDKHTFGYKKLPLVIRDAMKNYTNHYYVPEGFTEIEVVGLCTDICVVSNTLILKAEFYNEAEISVDASCCAGVTPETHEAALKTMEMCQINVKRG